MVSPLKSDEKKLQEQLLMLRELELGSTGQTIVPRKHILNFKLIPTQSLSGEAKRLAYRINSLVDLYWFSIVVLGKHRLQHGPDYRRSLHYNMCTSVMKDGLKDVIEIPRDHYKSTIYSECFPIWKALPFGSLEEDLFAKLGYSDLFIEWMRRAHNQNIRILLVSETIKNAIKLGTRISNHYQNNDTFSQTFPEIIPGSSETWTNDSLHQKRTKEGKAHGEGTFDFIGVGAALQSRHYDLAIQDDLVGKEALNSEPVMQSTIEYHQLLVGAMDADPRNPGKDFDELVVGNRWSHKDLNSHIRDNEPYFAFTTHSALGGCCALHPIGNPIFPEAFSTEKLLRWKKRLGSYYFSCQFLNFPIDPSKQKFNLKDFRYYHFENVGGATGVPKNVGTDKQHQMRTVIRHHVIEGDVEKDVFPRHLDRYLIIDPNHAGQHTSGKVGTNGRCRHAAIVSGILRNPRRVYLLETWAEACTIDKFVDKIFSLALKWKINKVYVEAVGAQKYLTYHLNFYKNANRFTKPEINHIRFEELKTPLTANAKQERIDNMVPAVERGEVWVNATTGRDFLEEAERYGQKKGLIDLLDVFGYGPQVWKFDTNSQEQINEFLAARMNKWKRGATAIL